MTTKNTRKSISGACTPRTHGFEKAHFPESQRPKTGPNLARDPKPGSGPDFDRKMPLFGDPENPQKTGILAQNRVVPL